MATSLIKTCKINPLIIVKNDYKPTCNFQPLFFTVYMIYQLEHCHHELPQAFDALQLHFSSN